MSATFNPLERNLARMLSRFPQFKKTVKRIHAFVLYALKRKRYKVKISEAIERLEHVGQNTFFGYYDKSPVNVSSNFIIYQQSSSDTSHEPDTSNDVYVCLCLFPSNTLILKVKVSAYNWQQGTKLQWINNKQFVFNDFDEVHNCYVSRIVDVESECIVRTLEKPIYDCFSDKFALTLSFERLTVYSPDYGYFAKPISESDLLPYELDGIFYVDLQTGEHKLQLSLKTIAACEPEVDFELAKHTVNHLMISPDGRRFMFIHRWFVNGRRFDRLMLSDVCSGEIKVVVSNEMVSHCFWYGSDKILGYLRGNEGLDSYWVIDCGTLSQARMCMLDGFGDGHPHIHNEWMITDTYPDKARMQHLLAVNLLTQQVKELGEFFHGLRYDAETRCDLHPRFSFDGNFVFFDSVASGDRRLYWMELKS